MADVKYVESSVAPIDFSFDCNPFCVKCHKLILKEVFICFKCKTLFTYIVLSLLMGKLIV